MTMEAAWFVGTPIVGASAIAVGLVVPRFRKRAAAALRDEPRILPLVARRVEEAPATNPLAPAAAHDDDPPCPDETSESEVARPVFGLRLARGLAGALRRLPRLPPPTGDVISEDAPAFADDADRESDRDDGLASVPAATNLIPFVPAPAQLSEARRAGTAASDVAPTANGDVAAPAVADRQARENGIIDLDVPPGEDPTAWRARVLEREATIFERDDQLQRARRDAEEEERRRLAEVEAVTRQREIENVAIAEEARVRSEARARKWYARIDLDLEAPSVEERMAIASSLGSVRAPWGGKLLRAAFAQEEDARIRARVIGALVSADHLDVIDPFREAFAKGGLERAAVFETLMPRQHDAPWISELLAPLLVA